MLVVALVAVLAATAFELLKPWPLAFVFDYLLVDSTVLPAWLTPPGVSRLTAMLIAVCVAFLGVALLSGPDVGTPPLELATVPEPEPAAPLTWTPPADLDASYATTDRFAVPSFSLAPVGDAGAGEWVIPSFAGMSPTGSLNDDS